MCRLICRSVNDSTVMVVMVDANCVAMKHTVMFLCVWACGDKSRIDKRQISGSENFELITFTCEFQVIIY